MDHRFDHVGFDFSIMERFQSSDPEQVETRNNLLEAVKAGRITPEDAEEKAFDHGLDSLVTPSWRGPNVLEFRAWSIEMTVAWLIWGAKRAVHRFYTPYRTQCFEWEIVSHGDSRGYQLKRLGPASLADVRAKASHSRTRLSFNLAVRNLWDRVQSGGVVCSARTLNGDEFKTISAAEAATLAIHINDVGQTNLVDAFNNAVVRYHTVTFSTAEILAEWASDDADRPLVLEDDDTENEVELVAEEEIPVVEDGAHERAGGDVGGVAPNRRGRRPAFAWDTIIRAEALRLLDLHGDFDPAVDPDWRPARLADNLLQFCRDTWDVEPSPSAMRTYVRQYQEEFRRLRAAN